MKSSNTPQVVHEQIRYHLFRYRQIDRAIKALERIQEIRETQPRAVAAIRRRGARAA